MIDDKPILDMDYTLHELIERFIYIGDEEYIIHRYVSGEQIIEPYFS